MKPLLRIVAVLALVFASTFIIIRMSGVLTEDDIKAWLEAATNINPWYVALAVVLILAIDLFIAVPTLTTSILSGFFLGFTWGGIVASTGLLSAGLIGYWLSRALGERLLKIIIRSEEKRNEAILTFQQYGVTMIILSRSSPILPEVSACMAGMTKMKFSKFFFAWSLNSIPYALIAAYSGSISSFENPKPAIFTIIGLYMVLWLLWFLYKRTRINPSQIKN